MAILALAEVIVAASEIKVPSLLPDLLDQFGLDLTAGGLIIAATGFTAVLLALPSGPIDRKLGPRMTGLLALAFISGGAILGASAGIFWLLLVSRVIEGIGGALIRVTVPGIVARWFPKERHGLAMGIVILATPFGGMMTFLLVPLIAATTSGWRGGWWAVAVFSFAALIIWALFLRLPSETDDSAETVQGVSDTTPSDAGGLRAALCNPNVWHVSLAMLCFMTVALCVVNFYPTFLNHEQGIPLIHANQLTAISAVVMIPGGLLCGLLTDRVGFRKVMVGGFVLLALVIMTIFQVEGEATIVLLVLFGIIGSAVPVACMVALPAVMGKPERVAMGMAVLTMISSVGYIVQPLLFGFLVETTDWVTAAYFITPICLVGVVFTALIGSSKTL